MANGGLTIVLVWLIYFVLSLNISTGVDEFAASRINGTEIVNLQFFCKLIVIDPFVLTIDKTSNIVFCFPLRSYKAGKYLRVFFKKYPDLFP